MKRACITGGAGFIGSNLADRLIADGMEVVVVDNFRTGRREFLKHALANARFSLVEADVGDREAMTHALQGCDWVFHFQANADVRHGLEHPMLDLEQNTICTANVLEAMRGVGVDRILFSSTGSVYGEPSVFPTPEDVAFPVQTSLYGASKLACEGLIGAYVAGFDFTAVICRFVSIMGERYTHGHLYDFYKALKADPTHLAVLGNGSQEKSYLYVQDCVEAMLQATNHHENSAGIGIYNLGTNETVVVDDSVKAIVDYLGLNPQIIHTGGRRGWVGDSPLIHLDTSRICSLGWKPRLSIHESILRTLAWFDQNKFILEDEQPVGGML